MCIWHLGTSRSVWRELNQGLQDIIGGNHFFFQLDVMRGNKKTPEQSESNWSISTDLCFPSRSKYKILSALERARPALLLHMCWWLCALSSAIGRWWCGISFCLKPRQNKRLGKKMKAARCWKILFLELVVELNDTGRSNSTGVSVAGLTGKVDGQD